MSKRAIVLALSGLGIPLALLLLVLPITWGYGGYLYGGPGKMHVTFADPDGPAYRAGLRVGDPVVPSVGLRAVSEDAGPIGTVAVVQRIEGSHVRDISFSFVPYSGRLAVQQRINKIVNGLAALAAFALAMVVVLRARDSRLGVRAATVLILAGATALALGGALVCNDAVAAEVLFQFLPVPLESATLWAAVALLGIFPSPVTRLRRALPIIAAVVFAYSIYIVAARLPFLLTGVIPSWPLIHFGVGLRNMGLIGLLLRLPLAVACVDAMMTTDDAHAAATRWLCSLWLVSWAFGVLPFVVAIAGSGILLTHYGDVIGAGAVAFLALGIAYPILRHRLVDLNILISRATVFTIVSLIIVVLFVTVEWGASKVLEQALGVTIERASIPAQSLTLVLVIVLGLSARWIHKFVETTMMRAFFRKRLRGLAEIEACAQEVDVATDVRAIVSLAVSTVVRSLDVRGCAIYTYDGSAYVRAASTGEIDLPERYGFNDVPPLKLRRWRRHVELTAGSPDTLFLPMLVRGDLLGFIACGAKIDRTAFLDDEVMPLTQLAHHIGLAQATLATPAGANSQRLSVHPAAL
ncbi:MAG TPA: GAF domain-containing protein [Candidatus Baltobacteraceae bacterium]|nr:GAF domain-containing protein [Candidatus Baltobacteraceae bacterium]